MMNSHWITEARDQFDALSRRHFSLFLRRVMGTVAPGAQYKHNWHIDAIAEYLAACASGEVRRLIINLPPRMLKSTMVSVAWPAWLLGHRPESRLMVASYAQSLGVKHSTDCRAVMESDWYRRLFAETELSRDQNEKEKFATTARGYRLAVSVGGAAIGEGGDILIADDPINPLQARARGQRDAVNQWFDHTFVTRLDDKQKGAIVVVMQRLHPEDLSGYLLEKGGWEHLCLPAIAPSAQVISIGGFSHARAEGEALHEAREDVALLERIKQDLGSANFNAQYQQAPLVSVGSFVQLHWFPRFKLDEFWRGGDTPPPIGGRVGGGPPQRADFESSPPVSPPPNLPPMGGGTSCVQSWDTGIKAGAQHDASACATFMVKDGVHHLVDMLAVRMEYPDLKRLMVNHAARFSPDAVLIEDKASGQSLLQDLRRETGLPVIACMPDADKLTRLARVTPLMEAGKVALPVHAPWLAAFEAELSSFPDGAHDDQVDVVSQYLNWVRGRTGRGEINVRRV